MAAEILYELHRDRDAFDAINHVLELDSSDLSAYIMKMRILLRDGVFDEVPSILDFIHQDGINEDLSVIWCEAQLLEFEQENQEEALASLYYDDLNQYANKALYYYQKLLKQEETWLRYFYSGVSL